MNYNFKQSGQDGLIEKMTRKDMLKGAEVRVIQTDIWGKALQVQGTSTKALRQEQTQHM